MKNFIKHAAMIVAAGMLAAGVVSCNKDKDGNNENGGGSNTTPPTMVGTWMWVKYVGNLQVEEELTENLLSNLEADLRNSMAPNGMAGIVYTLAADKSMEVHRDDQKMMTGTYSYANDKFEASLYWGEPAEGVDPEEYGAYTVSFDGNGKMYISDDSTEAFQTYVETYYKGSTITVKKAEWKIEFVRID